MFALFSSARTVLLMSDEALHIYAAQGSTARLVESVPWTTEGFAPYVARIAAEDCHGRPILLLYDMTEQYYKRDAILKASVMDRAAMLERKLKVAFPTHPVRGAMVLKEAGGPLPAAMDGASQSSGQVLYILAAVPESEALTKTLGAARLAGAQILGLALLPAESAGLVATLDAHVTSTNRSGRGRATHGWTALITQHTGGVLRQIVTKGEDLALTRMTPITVDPALDPQNWANEVAREFRSTVSYISRFGYRDEDPLRVVVVAPMAAGTLLEEAIKTECQYTCLPLADALRVMDWTGPSGPTIGRTGVSDTCAELIHVLWAGKKRLPTMPMQARDLQVIARPRLAALVAGLVLFLLLAGQVVQTGVAYGSFASMQGEMEDVQAQKARLDIQYQAEIARREALGFDVVLLQGAVDVHKDLEAARLDLTSVAQAISGALGQNMRLAGVEVTHPEAKDAPAQENAATPPYEMTLRLTFPADTDPDKGNMEVSALRDRIQTALPKHEVSVTKFLKDYSFDKEVVVESRVVETGGQAQDFLAIITIVEGRA